MRRRWWLALAGLAVVAVVALVVLQTGAGWDPRPNGPATPAPEPAAGPGDSKGEGGFRGMTLLDPQPAPDFALPAADGSTFRLADQSGKIVLLFFGYTYCPDVCPATLAVWRELADRLQDDAGSVRMVFVTVDPERDTPERLREHLPQFGAHIIGLTGTLEQLQPVWDAYGVKPERIELPESSMKYAVAHPAQVYLIDQEGRQRLLYPLGFTAEDIEADIRLLLAQGN